MPIATQVSNLGAEPIVDWMISDWPVTYPVALDVMARRTTAIRDGTANELVWLLEHPPIYTAGTGAKDADLINPGNIPLHRSGRGGQFTYHGPGQRIAYVMLDLKRRNLDVRALVLRLEDWLVGTLAEFNIKGEIRRDRVGVWVRHPTADGLVEDKIAAIGLRVSRSVSSHGISINVDPDLAHYDGIVPCGIREFGVTSLAHLGIPATMHDVDVALKKRFQPTFGPVRQIDLRSLIAPPTDTGA